MIGLVALENNETLIKRLIKEKLLTVKQDKMS